MKTVKFYALCCRNLNAVKRHAQYIPKEDLVIVINTQNEEFKTQATDYCIEESIEHYITESDGTPSTGKNSVFNLFKSSDYDYAVLIDGDDFVTPHGVWAYKQIANHEDAIDVLALEYQYGIWCETGYNLHIGSAGTFEDYYADPYLGVQDKTNASAIHGHGTRCFLKTYDWWQQALNGKVVSVFDEFSKKFSDVHMRWANLCYSYISKWETHFRLVMFSKKAVNTYVHNTDFMCGEDTLLYLDYKDAHVKGKLKLAHLFDRYPTYVYDCRVDGIIRQEQDDINPETELYQPDYGWYKWLNKLSDKYEEYESLGKMHSNQIDRIDLELPEDYKPNVLGLVNYPGKQEIKY